MKIAWTIPELERHDGIGGTAIPAMSPVHIVMERDPVGGRVGLCKGVSQEAPQDAGLPRLRGAQHHDDLGHERSHGGGGSERSDTEAGRG